METLLPLGDKGGGLMGLAAGRVLQTRCWQRFRT
jgi:hypothetical protein